MVAEVQNTTVTIYRGTTQNQFGDEIDSSTPLFQGLPAFLAETGKTTLDPSTSMPRTIRQVICHLPLWTGVENSDRVLDESTGDTYIIISVEKPPTLAGAPVDEILTLKRVTAQTV